MAILASRWIAPPAVAGDILRLFDAARGGKVTPGSIRHGECAGGGERDRPHVCGRLAVVSRPYRRVLGGPQITGVDRPGGFPGIAWAAVILDGKSRRRPLLFALATKRSWCFVAGGRRADAGRRGPGRFASWAADGRGGRDPDPARTGQRGAGAACALIPQPPSQLFRRRGGFLL